jgi:hypothetical protein
MERRYLAATIAMAATFAIFSHAFSSGLLTRVHDPRATLISEARCAAETLRARLLEKVNSSLGGGSAEEAQLRVELNLDSPAMAAMPAVPRPPVAPAAPVLAAKAMSPRAPACPTQRLLALRTPHDYERIQARAMEMQAKALALQQRMQAKALAEQAKLQSKALAVEAKMMAMQARVTSREMQREITRAALAQARADIGQARMNSHPCPGQRAVHVSARSDDGDTDVDVDLDQLSNQVGEQVSRVVNSSIRNF